MKDPADRWKGGWNDLLEDMRDFATHAGPTDAHILLLGGNRIRERPSRSDSA